MLKKLLLGLVAMFVMVGMAVAAVNINTATQEELESLPNVGPAKAKAILEYRKANGNFKSPEDIKSVKGFGEASFQKLKSHISVSGATVIDPAASGKADKKDAKAEKKAMKDEAKAEKKASGKAEKDKRD